MRLHGPLPLRANFSSLSRAPIPPPPSLVSAPPPTTLSLRRTQVESLAISGAHALPRKLETPVYERVRTFTFAALGLGLSATLIGMYLATREHNPGVDLARMQATVAALRRARVAARTTLLATAKESGEAPLGGGRVVKWWASGPRDAPTAVLLAGEDGESAALWGEVHTQLQTALGDQARVVSYHCTPPPAKVTSAADAAAGRPQPSSSSSSYSSLTHRLRAAQVAAEAALGGSSKDSTWGGLVPSQSPSRRVVHVHSGVGSWAGLALCGVAGSHQSSPPRVGAVLVAPQLLHLNRSLAWVSALPEASRSWEEDGGEQEEQGSSSTTAAAAAPAPASAAAKTRLQRLLDPPPQPHLPQALKTALDASSPRRSTMVGIWSKFGTAGTAAAMASRFDEDFRRWRSASPVLTPLEVSLCSSLASASAVAGGEDKAAPGAGPPVRVVTWGPGTTPSWVEPGVGAATLTLWASAATVAGGMMLPLGSQERVALGEVRSKAAAQAVGGVLGGRKGKAVAAVVVGSGTPTPGAAAAAVTPTPTPTPSVGGKVDKGDGGEKEHTAALLARLPTLLGLPLSWFGVSQGEQDAASSAYQCIEREMAYLPGNFSVALVDGRGRVEGEDLVCLPLQLPAVIVGEVLECVKSMGGGDKEVAGAESSKGTKEKVAPRGFLHLKV